MKNYIALELLTHRSFGPVTFGLNRSSVPNVLESVAKEMITAFSEEDKWDVFDRDVAGDLVIHYDLDNNVEYVESAPSKHYDVMFNGVNLFAHSAREVLKLVAGDRGYLVLESGHTFVVPDLDFAIGVDEAIDISSSDRKCDNIGIGRRNYFASIVDGNEGDIRYFA